MTSEKLEVGAIDLISEVNVGITIAFFCVVLACLFSFHQIYKHLRHYTRPDLQKHIVRILLMVPIYAIDSFLSLLFHQYSLYFDLLRDAYEAYVVYTFFRLLLSYLYSLPSSSSPLPPSSTSYDNNNKIKNVNKSCKDIPLSIIINNEEQSEDIHCDNEDVNHNNNDSHDEDNDESCDKGFSSLPSFDSDDIYHDNDEYDINNNQTRKREERRKKRTKLETTSNKQQEEEDKVVEIMERKGKMKHMIPLCCLPPITPGRSYFRLCKRLIYQFVLIKPLLAVMSIILLYYDLYGEGEYNLKKGYIYITLIDNLSVTVAMYCLVLFYYTVKEELKGFKPIPKFLCIKSIILFTFWQGIIIGVCAYLGIINGDMERGWSEENVTTGLQDFLICFEMFLLSILHRYSFGVKEYEREREEGWRDLIPCCSFCIDVFCCCCCCFTLLRNFINVISQGDVIEDGWNTFNLPRSFPSLPFRRNSSPHPPPDDPLPVHISDHPLLPLPTPSMLH